MNIEQAAQKIDWDLEGTLKRFSNNRTLLERFVRKFPADPTFGRLKQAVEQADYSEVETLAHTLKGVAGNLGFRELFEGSAALVNAVRSGQTGDIGPLWEREQQAYQNVLSTIEQIEW